MVAQERLGKKMIRIESEEGKIKRCVTARILPGSDLLCGIEEICKKHKILYGYVSCIGSLNKAGYMYLVKNENVKMKAGYGEVLHKTGPIEFLNGTGFICQNNGTYDIHYHATMCDECGNVFGGHLVKDENPALTTLDVMIFEIGEVEMQRVFDNETELTQFFPRKK